MKRLRFSPLQFGTLILIGVWFLLPWISFMGDRPLITAAMLVKVKEWIGL